MKETTEKLGSMKMNKLILVMSLPAIISMIVQALYNIVDSIFVSELGEQALTALALAYPMQMIIIAVFAGIGVGTNVVISRKIGEGKFKEASNSAEHGILIGLILWLILAILSFIIPERFISLFTDDQVVIGYAVTYLKIVMLFSFASIIAEICMNIMRATGDSVKSMKIQLLGAITNIILDPILIFGLLFFTEMGVTGAAVATVIGQMASMVYGIYSVSKANNGIKFSIKSFHYEGSIVKNVIGISVPAACMIGLGSFMVAGINFILATESDLAVAVFGIYFKLQSFIAMALAGLTQGLMPIISYSYGAKNKERLISCIKHALVIVSFMMIAGILVFNLFSLQLLNLFNSTAEMENIGITCLKVSCSGFLFMGLGMILATLFQSVGKPQYSLLASLGRQIIFLLPLAYILKNRLGLIGVWLAFPVAEFLCLVMVGFMMVDVYKTQIARLGSNLECEKKSTKSKKAKIA